jgi:hypothetical protein
MDDAAKRLSRLRRYSNALISTGVAVVVTVLVLCRPSLSPPALHSRVLQISAAQTTVLVDLQHSDVTDLAPSQDQLAGLATQADLVGDVMVTDPVLQDIGRIIGVSASKIEADAPVTSDVPRTVIEPDSGANALALIASPDQYKLEIQVDPTVPVIHIYTQAPSTAAALKFAQATVQGTRQYLAQVGGARGVAAANAIRLVQLGPPSGGVVNADARVEIGLLAFIVAFALAMLALAFGRRVRAGWLLGARQAEALQ